MFKLLFTSLLLLTPVSLFAGPCYLLIDDPGTLESSTISDFARTVISQYIRQIDPDPPGGISISDKSCKYRLTVDDPAESITVMISVENPDNSGDNMNGMGDSNNRGFPGFKEATLRAIFRAKPTKKDEVCASYATVITSDCGQKSSPTIVSPTTLPPPPPPKALTFQGSLQVNVNVDQANVFLNNQFIGVANKGKPLNKTGVQSGKMNLRVEASGHMVFSQVVHVETNAWTQISAILNPLTTQDSPQPAALPSSDNEWVEPFTEMIFVQIPGGCFQMGSNHKKSGPIHEVCVGDFYLGKYEVTQGEWQKVMGRNPSKSKNSSRHPVEMVSYYDIQEFITNLNSKGNTNFRLPYEAEWEYAAKGGGKQFQYSTKNGSINSSSVNFDSEGIFSIGFLLRSSEDGFKDSAPVGSFPLNFFGIADMTGNLWEWIHDYYGKAYYASGAKNNPKGPEKGKYRIFRGGSWNDSNVDYLSTSFRYLKKPGYKNNTVGFRLAIQN